MHFICIAFLIKNKNKIKEVEEAQVPSIISQLKFKDKDDVDDLIQRAIDLYLITPKSLFKLGNNLNIFTFQSNQIKELFENYSPNLFYCLPIFPSEVLSLIYQDQIKCINDECPCFINKFQKIKNPECIYCNLKIPNLENYIIVDLRVIDIKEKRGVNNFINMDETTINPGYLIEFFIPNLTKVKIYENNEDENDESFTSIYNQILVEIGGKNIEKTHIIFLITETNYFKETDYRKYKQIISGNEITNLYTHLRRKSFHNYKIDFKENEFNNIIFENKLLEKLVKFLQTKNVKYISYVYGGYKGIHDILLKYKLPIISHGNKCLLCKRLKSEGKKIEDDNKSVEIDNKNNPFVSFFKKRISSGLSEIKKNLNIKKEEKEDDISNINLPNEFSNFDEILINKSVDKENIYKCQMKNENKIKECFLVITFSKLFIYNENENENSDKKFISLTVIKYSNLQYIKNNIKYKNSVFIYFNDENKINQLLVIDFLNYELIKEFIQKIQIFLDIKREQNLK